jgi:predicted O-methyltransferase YrrM
MRIRPCAKTLEPEMTDEELSALREWMRSARLKGRHLEIGTAAGGTLCFMMTCYKDGSRPPFSVVDTMSYFEDQFDTVRKNLANNGLNAEDVDFRVMSSDRAFARAEAQGERFAFMLVDASHKIRHVMADLRWMRLLKVGGLACFHDYGTEFKGVTWPVDRFLRHNPHFSRVGRAGRLLCIRREIEARRPEVGAADRLWALAWSPVLQWELSFRKRVNRKDEVTET